MRTILVATALVLAAGSGFAADAPKPSAAQAAQQARFRDCNADAKAKTLKGDERKTFMSGCLKKKPEAAKA
jgi:hypothetical protein